MKNIKKTDKKIIEQFNALCKYFDNGKGEKEKYILKILKENDIEANYIKGIGIIVPAKERKVVCVSHIDLIPSFNRAFKKGKKTNYIEKDKYLCGALDNTITNAILLSIIIENKKLLDTVEVVFTQDEEIGFYGMVKYLEKIKDDNPFFINLDVTNDNYGFSASIEYDKPSFEAIKELQLISKEISGGFGFTTDRVGDDLCAVMQFNKEGLSYCLPTQGIIHSFDNKTEIKKLQPYKTGLIKILSLFSEKNLSLKKDISGDRELKVALKSKDKKEYKKGLKAQKKKREEEFATYQREVSYGSGYSEAGTFAEEILGVIPTYSKVAIMIESAFEEGLITISLENAIYFEIQEEEFYEAMNILVEYGYFYKIEDQEVWVFSNYVDI